MPMTHRGLSGGGRRKSQVVVEPIDGQPGDLVEGSRLLEEKGGSGNDRDPVGTLQLGGGHAIEVEHQLIGTADDQEDRSCDGGVIASRLLRSEHRSRGRPVGRGGSRK